jgi:hypothetical protein
LTVSTLPDHSRNVFESALTGQQKKVNEQPVPADGSPPLDRISAQFIRHELSEDAGDKAFRLCGQ